MKTYYEKLQDPRWQRLRSDVLRRDGWACRDCRDTTKTLHVHHCHYERGNPWDTPMDLLLTLCSECHKTRQKLEDDARRSLGEMFATLDWCHYPELVGSITTFDPECESSLLMDGDHQYKLVQEWLKYATEHPEAREAHDKITGKKIDWLAIDEAKAWGCPF